MNIAKIMVEMDIDTRADLREGIKAAWGAVDKRYSVKLAELRDGEPEVWLATRAEMEAELKKLNVLLTAVSDLDDIWFWDNRPDLAQRPLPIEGMVAREAERIAALKEKYELN